MPSTQPTTALAGVEADASEELRAPYLLDRAAWLIRLRWYALFGLVVVALTAARMDLLDEAPPIAGAIVVMALCNASFRANLATLRKGATAKVLRRAIFVQLLLDVVVLVALLHWSDALENPFGIFFVFPMVLAAMLLPRNTALGLAATGWTLHATSVLAEAVGLLRHHPFAPGSHHEGSLAIEDPFFESPIFIAAHLVTLAAVLFGVVLFVDALVTRWRQADALRRERERVALSRARLAQVGELSAGVAHAIRNPLHGIMNCVEILSARAADDPAAAETLELMDEGLRKIEGVTRRLLALTREAPVCPVTSDVDALVQESVRFVSGRARAKDVTVSPRLGAVGSADLDPDRFGEALANVLDNAIDAQPRGEVTVQTRREGGPDGRVVIEVRDTGDGIPEENMAKIFDPFFTTKAVGEGTGLGLAIARRVAAQHGATLEVESVRGEGTVVRFVLAPGGATPEASR